MPKRFCSFVAASVVASDVAVFPADPADEAATEEKLQFRLAKGELYSRFTSSCGGRADIGTQPRYTFAQCTRPPMTPDSEV